MAVHRAAPIVRSPLRLAALAMAAGVAAMGPPSSAGAQDPGERGDTNILFSVEFIERQMLAPHLQLLNLDRSRPVDNDRNRRVTLGGPDGEPLMDVHWKPVAPPGTGFNNEPRYELAANRLQRLFLDEPDYVVPPTVLRAMPVEEHRFILPLGQPTIRGTRSVLFLLSYWVQNLNVDTVDPFDPTLFDRDEVYARHFANANTLTYLIEHKDGNHGNVLVSRDAFNRRVFSVDNDVAWRSDRSDKGVRWRTLHVTRLPATTVARLRELTREQLDAELGVLAEFQVVDDELVAVEPGENLGVTRGLRIQDDRVQFGLTRAEIGDLEQRIQRLLRDVDRGRITTF
jgi:hypothetical protein